MIEIKERFADYLVETPNFLSIFIFSTFFNLTCLILIEISRATGILTVELGFIYMTYMIAAAIGVIASLFCNRRFLLHCNIFNFFKNYFIYYTFRK
jgi:hypothetical protein